MLTVASINIEHSKNLARVQGFLHTHQPDVMLLQEVRYGDLFHFASHLGIGYQGVAYAPVSLFQYNGNISPIGLTILSRLPLSDIRHCDLRGRTLVGRASINRERIQQNLLFATVKDAAGHSYRLATTHLDVTCHGAVTARQLLSVNHLLQVAEIEAEAHGGLLLAGDFNAPRGRQAFDRMAKVFTDNIPPECTTTIDNTLHRVKDTPQKRIDFVVDGVFTRTYRVANLTQHEGVSDHLAHLYQVHSE